MASSGLRLAVIAVALGACGHTAGIGIRGDQVGTKYATITAYFATRSAAPGGTSTEGTPGNIRHDAVIDEATLASVSATETCVDVVVRTDSVHDEPLQQLAPTFTIDDVELRGVIEQEVVSVVDYAYTGQRDVFSLEGVSATAFVGMSLTAPTDNVLRVIERRGRVCAGQGGTPRKVSLDITNPSWDIADYNYYIEFEWSIDGAPRAIDPNEQSAGQGTGVTGQGTGVPPR